MKTKKYENVCVETITVIVEKENKIKFVIWIKIRNITLRNEEGFDKMNALMALTQFPGVAENSMQKFYY